MKRLNLFATAARGTEPLLAEELAELGAVKVKQDRGGVRFSANLQEALRVALWSRIAMRVLYPLAESEAQGADGLYAAAEQVPWEEHLDARTTFAVEATLRDSEHKHSGFVALKVKDAVADRLRRVVGARPDVDVRNPAVRIVAHLHRQQLSLSLDLCGEPLHRRGYRVAVTPAPMKETLAAAVLRSVGYTGDEPLLDPLCGSGTLLIEAALIASRRAPALARTFAIERWPKLGEQVAPLLAELRAEARAHERPPGHALYGFDKDEEALAAARRNVAAAGLARRVTLELADATQGVRVPATPPGLLVTNPPYGDRLGGGSQRGMKAFYFKLGESFAALPTWRVAVLSGNPAFESAFHRRPNLRKKLWNGPIECDLLGYPPLPPGAARS